MGFEDQVPPVPSRQQEIDYIERMKKNFLDQPYHKQYMNEALRETKIEHSNKMNSLRSKFWFNFGLGTVIFGVAFIKPVTMIYRNPGGVPFVYAPKFKPWSQMNYNQNRNLKAMKLYVGLVTLCSTWYALHFTDSTPLEDEYYTRKAPKVYPF